MKQMWLFPNVLIMLPSLIREYFLHFISCGGVITPKTIGVARIFTAGGALAGVVYAGNGNFVNDKCQ